MNKINILIEMRALLAKGWTQGAFARGEDDTEVSPGSPLAVKFCPLGAFERVVNTNSIDPGPCSETLYALFKATPGGAIGIYNDNLGRTQAEVLAWLDGLIATEKENAKCQPLKP